MTSITPEEAQAELARREEAKRNLSHFSEYVFPNYPIARHIEKMDEELEKVIQYIETGKGTSRLIIEAPPRHFKTIKVSKLLPAFFLGRNPSKEVIITSYSGELATASSRAVKDIICSASYQNVFGKRSLIELDPEEPMPGVQISPDVQQQDYWEIDQYGGRFIAAGIQGRVTGWGADLIVIDDPYRGRKEAESPTIRRTTLEYYDSTLYPRLQENSAIVLIMQRWRKDDLVGMLKARSDPHSEYFVQGADEWKILTFPAIAERDDLLGRKEGEALWPEKFPVPELIRRRNNMGTYSWQSQYQQKPTDPEGAIIKKEWFRTEAEPYYDWGVQVWDTAMKEGQDNDYWVGMFLVPTDRGIHIKDIVRRKMSFPEGERAIQDFYNRWNLKGKPVLSVRVEDAVGGMAAVQQMQRDTRLPIIGYKPSGDKEYRLRGASKYIESQRVSVETNAPWLRDFFEEVTGFPYAEHDDIVDVLSEGVNHMASMGATDPRPNEVKKKTKREMLSQKTPKRTAMRSSPLS